MRPGDILAHPFTRHPAASWTQTARCIPSSKAALERGLKTDVGHGSHSQLPHRAQVLDAGILPDTLAPTCTATTPASRRRRHAERAPGRGEPPLRRQARFS
jgi:predicted amidohydrolase